LQTTPGGEINVLHQGGLLKARLADTALHTIVLTLDNFLFDEQGQTFFKRKLIVLRGSELRFQSLAKSGQAQQGELIE
jgi:hypothetical protein